MILKRLDDHGVLIKPAKCALGVPQLEFLEHLVDNQRNHPLEEKVQATQNSPQPTTQHKLREFLGLVNFSHCFLPHCAETLQPLMRYSQPQTNPLHQDQPPVIDLPNSRTQSFSNFRPHPSHSLLKPSHCRQWTPQYCVTHLSVYPCPNSVPSHSFRCSPLALASWHPSHTMAHYCLICTYGLLLMPTPGGGHNLVYSVSDPKFYVCLTSSFTPSLPC